MSSTFQPLKSFKYFFILYFYSGLCALREFTFGILRKLSICEPVYDENLLHEDLSGCVCLLVGATTGSIGRCLIPKLLEKNCYLIITFHNEKSIDSKKADLMQNELKGVDPSLYRFEYLNYASLDSVVNLVKRLKKSSQKINFFISNAGIALNSYHVSEDGFENQLQVNFLAGSLLLIGLFPLIVQTAKLAKKNNEPKSKIVFTNSCTHRFVDLDLEKLDYAGPDTETTFSTHQIYPLSKLYQLMFNLQFTDQFIKNNNLSSLISFINVHPGMTNTNLFDQAFLKVKLRPIFDLIAMLMKTPEDAAINVAIPILSADPFFDSTEALYLEDLKNSEMKWECKDKDLRVELFQKTLSLLKKYITQLDLQDEQNEAIF